MSEQEHFEAVPTPDGAAIGVGMGGSCPVCRAPVGLGQEFCLECGSPIRFTPRQRRPQRGIERRGPAEPATRRPPPRTGFPWVPFLVVLALIGGGVAFALVDGDDRPSGGRDRDSAEPALPTITNSTPDLAQGQTTTVPECPDPLAGTQPAVGATDGSGGEQIPSLGDGATPADADVDPFADPSVPSTGPEGTAPVTVDEAGTLCASAGEGDGGAAPVDDGTPPDDGGGGISSPSDPDGGGTGDGAAPSGGSSAPSGDWPAGKEGWTVVVAGYDTQERAAQRAADLQEQGLDDGGVLFSSDYRSLCPGIHVVFSGTFERRAQAEERRRELGATGSYVREIRTTGPAATGCRPAQ